MATTYRGEKMNVELTIQQMYDKFPALFKERSDCLNQFFCVIGNGFYWVDGELVNCDLIPENQETLISRLVNGKAFQYNKLSIRGESIYYALSRKRRLNQDVQENIMDTFDKFDIEYFESLPDDIYYKDPRNKRWYFCCNICGHQTISFYEPFAYLFNYPENIKPDWKAAIDECRTMLIEDGYDLPR